MGGVPMALGLHQKVAMVLLSMAAPRRLAGIFLRPHPQPMREGLELAEGVERIAFPSAGGAQCRGWWLRPPGGDTAPCVLVAHGWTSHALRMRPVADALVAGGFQVLLYNARSHGDSDHHPVCSLAQFTEDAVAAAAFARTRADRVAAVGHSLGAAASLVAAADGAPVSAVVAMAGPAHPARASADILQAQGVPADLILRRIGRHVEAVIGRSFESIAVEQRITQVPCPVLLFHGTADEVVPVAHFHRIRAAAGESVEAHLLEGVNHDQVKSHPFALERTVQFLQDTLKPVPVE